MAEYSYVSTGSSRLSSAERIRGRRTATRRDHRNLAKTLCSTNPCESMIEIVRHTQCNVKRWRDGDMRKLWTAAGMLVAEQQFRRA